MRVPRNKLLFYLEIICVLLFVWNKKKSSIFSFIIWSQHFNKGKEVSKLRGERLRITLSNSTASMNHQAQIKAWYADHISIINDTSYS